MVTNHIGKYKKGGLSDVIGKLTQERRSKHSELYTRYDVDLSGKILF